MGIFLQLINNGIKEKRASKVILPYNHNKEDAILMSATVYKQKREKWHTRIDRGECEQLHFAQRKSNLPEKCSCGHTK